MNTNEFIEFHYLNIFDNAVLAWGLIACGLAQVLKLFFELLFNKKWRPEIIFETGGMPSSHSALITGTAAGLGLEIGFDNPVFAFAATVAFVVMYDASGVRRSAGLTAERVNLLPVNSWKSDPGKKLKENLGHSKLEVIIGSLLGPAIALPGIVFLGSPIHIIKVLGLYAG